MTVRCAKCSFEMSERSRLCSECGTEYRQGLRHARRKMITRVTALVITVTAAGLACTSDWAQMRWFAFRQRGLIGAIPALLLAWASPSDPSVHDEIAWRRATGESTSQLVFSQLAGANCRTFVRSMIRDGSDTVLEFCIPVWLQSNRYDTLFMVVCPELGGSIAIQLPVRVRSVEPIPKPF